MPEESHCALRYVANLGEGVKAALKTQECLLGLEDAGYENPSMRPEYVSTVEVARALSDWDRRVCLECQKRQIRISSSGVSLRGGSNSRLKFREIKNIAARYVFGAKDSERVDVAVFRSFNEGRVPLLIAEVKLSISSLTAIENDIDRIVGLLEMMSELGVFRSHDVYGAVIFHVAREGGDETAAQQFARNRLDWLERHLQTLRSRYDWLHGQAGLLFSSGMFSPAEGELIEIDDRTGEDVYELARDSFNMIPALVLLGNRGDAGRWVEDLQEARA